MLQLNCVVKWTRNLPFGAICVGCWRGWRLDPIRLPLAQQSTFVRSVCVCLSMRAYLASALTASARSLSSHLNDTIICLHEWHSMESQSEYLHTHEYASVLLCHCATPVPVRHSCIESNGRMCMCFFTFNKSSELKA